jgi:DNA polymerase-3 subunit alpha
MPKMRVIPSYTSSTYKNQAPPAPEALDTGSLSISKASKMDAECENFVIIFDLETTGLPAKPVIFGFPCPTKLSAYDDCRIVQICAMLCNKNDLSCVELKNIIIKSDGFDIPNSDIHGITPEKSDKEGILFKKIFEDELGKLFKKAKYALAHNAEFDMNVLKSELFRYGISDVLDHVEHMEPICSMKKTKRLVGALNSKKNVKNPSLAELYKFSTGKEISNQHNAEFDVVNLHEAVSSLHKDKKLILFPL